MPTQQLTVRRIIVATATLAITAGVAGCGGNGTPSRDQIAGAIEKHKSDFGGTITHDNAECLAGVFQKYVKGDALRDAVSDKKDDRNFEDSLKHKGDAPKFSKEAAACLKVS